MSHRPQIGLNKNRPTACVTTSGAVSFWATRMRCEFRQMTLNTPKQIRHNHYWHCPRERAKDSLYCWVHNNPPCNLISQESILKIITYNFGRGAPSKTPIGTNTAGEGRTSPCTGRVTALEPLRPESLQRRDTVSPPVCQSQPRETGCGSNQAMSQPTIKRIVTTATNTPPRAER